MYSKDNYTTLSAIDFHVYHSLCHPGLCAYHMLLVEGREEIYYLCGSIQWEGVSFWFDCSQDHCAAGIWSSLDILAAAW